MGCLSADNTLSCQTITFPSDVINSLSVEYEIVVTGGNSMSFYVDIKIGCSNLISILPPGVFYTDPIHFIQNSGD